jgi:hypothetical protein
VRRWDWIWFGAALVAWSGMSASDRNVGLSGARGWAVGVGSLGAASCNAAARLPERDAAAAVACQAAACELVLLPQIASVCHVIPASETD